MPAIYETFERRRSELHPGWEIARWCERNIPRLEHQDMYDRAEELTAGNVWQFRSDIVRYELLWRHGGVYTDVDFEWQKAIDPLLGGVECFAVWEKQDIWAANGLMGATPEHPFVGRLLSGLRASVDANKDRRPNVSTGPQYLTKVYREHPDGVSVFDEKSFIPYAYNELDRGGEAFPEAYAIHHWNNQRKMRGKALT